MPGAIPDASANSTTSRDPRADTGFAVFARWWIERSIRAAAAASPAEAA